MTKELTEKEQGKEQSIRIEYSALLPYLPQAPLDEGRLAYLTGRVLRDADEEVFRAFVELVCGLVADPALPEQVLPLCEIVTRVRDRRPADPAPAVTWRGAGTSTPQ